MSKIKTAVIGTGYLGKFHTQKYANLDQCDLIAICDLDHTVATSIADQYNCQAITDFHQLLDKVDAVSIVTPTQTHYAIAKTCLEHGVHVLIEKPITTTVKEADELIALAKQHHCVLQVGHLERFNPVIEFALPYFHSPAFIDSVRIAPFNERGTDVNVILDLMIHDIDLIYQLIKSPIRSIHANGTAVVSPTFDIANARIEFENNCVANVTASRVSIRNERRMRVFEHHAYASLDLLKLEAHVSTIEKSFPINIGDINHNVHQFEKQDAIRIEIEHFIDSILHDKPAVVSGEDGRIALEIATQITDKIHSSAPVIPTR